MPKSSDTRMVSLWCGSGGRRVKGLVVLGAALSGFGCFTRKGVVPGVFQIGAGGKCTVVLGAGSGWTGSCQGAGDMLGKRRVESGWGRESAAAVKVRGARTGAHVQGTAMR